MAPSSPHSLSIRSDLPTLADLPSSVYVLDDSNTTSINYTLPFLQVNNSTCHGGTCTELLGEAGSLEFNFTGTDVWLFGKPGGIARIFVDDVLTDVLDTSGIPNDGRALWATNGLSRSDHCFKVGGVEGDSLNLLVDFFGVAGIVTSSLASSGSNPQTTTPSQSNDSTSSSPSPAETKKLTGIIVGSLIGFIATLILIALLVFFYLRRKKAQARNGVTKKGPSPTLPKFSFGRKNISRKPIVLLRRQSTEKEPGFTPFNSTYPLHDSSYTSTNSSYPSAYPQQQQFDQGTPDHSVPRFVLPDSPPSHLPRLAIPDQSPPTVPPSKLSPGQYIMSKMPWSTTAYPAVGRSTTDQQETTPLMEVSSQQQNLPWMQRREGAPPVLVASNLSSNRAIRHPETNPFKPVAPLANNNTNYNFAGSNVERSLGPRRNNRGDSFGTLASSTISSAPSFRTTASPSETLRPLPAVPESVAGHGPKEDPWEDTRTLPEDRYGWRNGLEQWDQLGGVKLVREGQESPVDRRRYRGRV